MRAFTEARNSVIVHTERKILTRVDEKGFDSVEVAKIHMNKEAGGDEIWRDKARARSATV